MKSKYLLLFIMSLGMLNAALSQKSLNVMSFNIRLDVASDSADNWKFRKDNLMSQVLFHETDILGVQEAIKNQMEDLAKGLRGYKYVGVPRDSSQRSEYSAIFYDTSRLRVIEQNTFWLSEDIHAAGQKGWDAALPRIVTWAKFKDRHTRKVFYLFNTHFDHMGQIARRESAKLLLDQITLIAGRLPVIVMGDFNAVPADEPIKILLDKSNPAHLTDAKSVSKTPHYGPVGTFNGFKSAEIRNEPIDYIFIKNNVKVLRHATLSQTWKGRFASDHFPVFARITL